jgi:hypothetical protein
MMDSFILQVEGFSNPGANTNELLTVLRGVAVQGTEVVLKFSDHAEVRLKVAFEIRTLGDENVRLVHEACKVFYQRPYTCVSSMNPESSEDEPSDDPSSSEKSERPRKTRARKQRRTEGPRTGAVKAATAEAMDKLIELHYDVQERAPGFKYERYLCSVCQHPCGGPARKFHMTAHWAAKLEDESPNHVRMDGGVLAPFTGRAEQNARTEMQTQITPQKPPVDQQLSFDDTPARYEQQPAGGLLALLAAERLKKQNKM